MSVNESLRLSSSESTNYHKGNNTTVNKTIDRKLGFIYAEPDSFDQIQTDAAEVLRSLDRRSSRGKMR